MSLFRDPFTVFGVTWVLLLLPISFLVQTIIAGYFMKSYLFSPVRESDTSNDPRKYTEEEKLVLEENRGLISGSLTLIGLSIAGFTFLLNDGLLKNELSLQIFSISLTFLIFSISIKESSLTWHIVSYIQEIAVDYGMLAIVLALYYLTNDSSSSVGTILLGVFIFLLVSKWVMTPLHIIADRNSGSGNAPGDDDGDRIDSNGPPPKGQPKNPENEVNSKDETENTNQRRRRVKGRKLKPKRREWD